MSKAFGSKASMIEATIGLLRGSGLSGAGINDIVRESGAPKGSVYHFFPNGKVQIVSEALDIYSQRVLAFVDEALTSKRAPADKIRALFNAFARRVAEGAFRKSCAFGTVSLDLDAELEGVRAVLKTAFSKWKSLLEEHFEFDDPRRAKSFAGLVLTNIEGAYIRCRVEHSSQPFREAGAWLAELAARH